MLPPPPSASAVGEGEPVNDVSVSKRPPQPFANAIMHQSAGAPLGRRRATENGKLTRSCTEFITGTATPPRPKTQRGIEPIVHPRRKGCHKRIGLPGRNKEYLCLA